MKDMVQGTCTGDRAPCMKGAETLAVVRGKDVYRTQPTLSPCALYPILPLRKADSSHASRKKQQSLSLLTTHCSKRTPQGLAHSTTLGNKACGKTEQQQDTHWLSHSSGKFHGPFSSSNPHSVGY